MKKKILILILISCFIITGCSYQELNKIAIATVIGVDYDKEKDTFKVSAQVFDFNKKDATSTNEGVILYVGEGSSIATAIRNIYLKYPMVLHLGHLQLMVLGEELVENKTNDIFDYFLRSPETSSDFYVIVAKDGSAYELLNIGNKDEQAFNANELLENIENDMNRQGISFKVDLEEFLAKVLKKGIDPVLPTVKYIKESDDKHSNTYLLGISSFKDNVLNEILSSNASRSYNLINNNINDIMYDTNYDNTNLSIIVYNPNCGINVNIDNGVNVTINIKGEGHISEVHKDVNLLDEKVLNKINDILIKKIESDINELIKYCKDYNVDILGINNMIYMYHTKEYDKYKDKNMYELSSFKIDIDIDIYRHGTLYYGTIGG